MATATKTGFDVTCPYCHAEDQSLAIDLNTLECHCRDCDEEFSVRDALEQAEKLAAKWAAVVRWVNLIPQAKSE